MSKIRVVFKNISWLAVAQMINSICAFFWTIVIANYLGVTKYGIISFSTSFIGIAILLIDLGITTYVTREVARNRKRLDEYINLTLPLKLILSFAVFFLGLFFLIVSGCGKTTIVVTLIYMVEMILMTFTQLINGIFQAYEELKYQSIGALINCGLLIGGILITILSDWGIYGIALSYVVGYSGFFGFMAWRYVKQFGWPSPKINCSKSLLIIKKSLPFGITTLFNTIYFGINTVMLSGMKGDYEAGIYKAVFNILLVFTTLFSVYQLVLFPVVSNFFVNQKGLIQKSYEKSVKYLMAVILPICAGIFFYAKQILMLIYNQSYGEAILPLKISIWTVIVLFLNGATILVLNAINMERRVTMIYLLGAVVNVLINLLLVPGYSYNGSAVATLTSCSFIFLILLTQISKTEFQPGIHLLMDVVKIAIATMGMFLVLCVLHPSLWVGIFVGVLVYGALFIGLRLVDETDCTLLKLLIHKEKEEQ
ncbi:MAG: flippase [Eubacterium sp.]|nr:flippase [Eubacterium sp.]